MQKIFIVFSLLIANTEPTVIAAGKAGGTVIVIKSSDLSTMSHGSGSYCNKNGSVMKKPVKATQAMKTINLRLSV